MATPASRWRQRLFTLATSLTVTLAASVAWSLPAHAASVVYTALGDSYSSGVGTRTYYSDGTNCQRSPMAYPVLVKSQLAAATFVFAACGGAKVTDVLNTQLGSLSATTTHVTVSVGGNDAGFGNVIGRCALPWPYTCWGEIDNANAYITGTLPGALDNLYNRIRALAPKARVVVVGYPRLFNESDCQSLARISPGEQIELNDTADLLATTIKGRATAHGFAFVDPRSSFTGHAICDATEWINGISNPTSESYHPNQAGHASGYAPLVKSALLATTVKAAAKPA
ncbi:SGNH/GDSL hydrolase family protein [Dactylosporangium sp. AC04546]|uniref:SGNH/GDSL hydrolase family protein n=1 Tax=Dactylosporangium sp. AC04546 TaxID=2862460 RepID=UPI001EDC967B|nr:SGNH/GDSL hydrolase family protein [Dactylosporangium sp. AC04546]WVK80349.1 SGNH/GDSL hydrolase family protein [Dactylosporangium sp. AC04546]